jgi:tRNA uridine 5-carboxymethylaminomethyl modification enzyme
LELLKRPEITYLGLTGLLDHEGQAVLAPAPGLAREVWEQVEIQTKYAGYIARQRDEVARQQSQERAEIPDDIDYEQVRGLSVEVRQKLMTIAPRTLGQASRISGVTPAAISLLWIHIKRLRAGKSVGPDQKAA